MIRSHRWSATVFLCVVATTSAIAQSVSGRVVNASSQSPIAGVTVSLLDGQTVLVSARSDDSGFFRIAAPRPGRYPIRFRLIGYEQLITAPVQLDAGTQLGPTVYRLTAAAVRLDTVASQAAGRAALSVTSGSEIFRQHFLLNQGVLVSGLELQRSKLPLLEYLGTLPGLRYVPSVPAPAPGGNQATSPPALPGRNGFLVSAFESRCLYGRIDRWSVISLMEQYGAMNIEELITVDDIMAVEVYQTKDDIPKEWRSLASTVLLVWRSEIGGRNYLIGDIGMSSHRRYSIRADPRDPVDNRPAPRNPNSVRSPFSPSTGRGATLALIDTVDPPSFSLPSMSVPPCGFVQIWTRVAW